MNRTSIYRWQQAAAAGPEALAARPHPHRPPRLNDEQLRELESLLAQGTKAHGWQNELWTTALCGSGDPPPFQDRLPPRPRGAVLTSTSRLDTSKASTSPLASRNEKAILDWQSQAFPLIARAAEERNAHLVFLDESGFMLTPSVRRTWAPRGQTPILDAWDRRDRISAISSISVSPTNRRLNLHFNLLPDNTNVHAEDIVAYLKHLKAQIGGPLTVIWDGSKLHDRSRLVKAFSGRTS